MQGVLLLPALMVVSVAASDPVFVPSVAEVDHDTILPCVISSDMRGVIFDWKRDDGKQVFLYDKGKHYIDGELEGQDPQFKDRVDFFPNQLQHGNASIKLKSAKVSDSGVYTCTHVSNREHFPVFKVNLTVNCTLKDRSIGPNAKEGAFSKPAVNELGTTKEGVLLLCDVLGAFPKPEVEWQDSSNKTVQSKHPNVITVVKKTDEYRCVVKQLNICHASFSDWIHVDMTEEQSAWSLPWIGFIVTLGCLLLVLLVLLLLVVQVALLRKCYYSKNNNGESIEDRSPALSHLKLQCFLHNKEVMDRKRVKPNF